MGMLAAAAYLQALREGRSLSWGKLARRAELNEMVVWRLEVKHSSIQSSSLAALVAVLQADIEAIHQLMLDPVARFEDGQRAAAVTLGYVDAAATGPLDNVAVLAELETLVRTDPAFVTLLRRMLRAWRLAQTKAAHHNEEPDQAR